MAAEIVGSHERYARWSKGYIGNRRLPDLVPQAFIEADPPPDAAVWE